jgi:pimeloyl-ACP methyl ester carboxylesterase
MRRSMAERWVDVTGEDGVRLAVRDVAGPDPTSPSLVLHHGLASSQRIWDLMLPHLVRRFRVVTYDARGHGLSGKPSTGYGFDHVVGDLRAVVRARGLRRPLVVGHSWGAMVALEAVAAVPRSFAGTVLVDGGLVRLRDSFPDRSTAERELAPPELDGTPVEEFRGMIRTFLGDALEVTPEVEAIVLSVMRVDRNGRIHPRLSRANHMRILRAIWEYDPEALIRRSPVPALAILARGGGEAFDDTKRVAVRRARAAARGPLSVSWVEGIHDLPLQHPTLIATKIQRFATAR